MKKFVMTILFIGQSLLLSAWSMFLGENEVQQVGTVGLSRCVFYYAQPTKNEVACYWGATALFAAAAAYCGWDAFYREKTEMVRLDKKGIHFLSGKDETVSWQDLSDQYSFRKAYDNNGLLIVDEVVLKACDNGKEYSVDCACLHLYSPEFVELINYYRSSSEASFEALVKSRESDQFVELYEDEAILYKRKWTKEVFYLTSLISAGLAAATGWQTKEYNAERSERFHFEPGKVVVKGEEVELQPPTKFEEHVKGDNQYLKFGETLIPASDVGYTLSEMKEIGEHYTALGFAIKSYDDEGVILYNGLKFEWSEIGRDFSFDPEIHKDEFESKYIPIEGSNGAYLYYSQATCFPFIVDVDYNLMFESGSAECVLTFDALKDFIDEKVHGGAPPAYDESGGGEDSPDAPPPYDS